MNGMEAVTLIESKQPDLALLDLQMPEVDGLGVVRLLKKNRMPLVAFVTAYDEYAVRAFEVNAVDYILKPVERARAYAKPSIGRGNVWSTRNTNLKLRNVFAQPYPTTKPQESGLCSNGFRFAGMTKSSLSLFHKLFPSSPTAKFFTCAREPTRLILLPIGCAILPSASMLPGSCA